MPLGARRSADKTWQRQWWLSQRAGARDWLLGTLRKGGAGHSSEDVSQKTFAPLPHANRIASGPHPGSPKLLAPVRRRGLFCRVSPRPTPSCRPRARAASRFTRMAFSRAKTDACLGLSKSYLDYLLAGPLRSLLVVASLRPRAAKWHAAQVIRVRERLRGTARRLTLDGSNLARLAGG